MWLLWTSLALAGTVTVDTDEAVGFTIAGASAQADGKGTEISGLSAGAHAVRVSRGGALVWAGELRLPSDDVDATLRWKKGGLTVSDVKVNKSRAEKLMTAGNIASGVAAGAQQASALSQDASAARSDFDKAQSGELTESSRTEMSMEIGPGGVNSSSSRTTAGASGVEHSATSSSIGRDGSSLSTTEARLDGSGYQERSEDKSLKMAAGDRGDVVLIGGPVRAGEALEAAPAAPAVASLPAAASPATGGDAAASVELPPEVIYDEPREVERDGLTLQFFDPISTADESKLAIKFTNEGDSHVTFSKSAAVFDFDGSKVSPAGRRASRIVVVPPGSTERQTFSVEGGPESGLEFRRPDFTVTVDGLARHEPAKPSGIGDAGLAAEALAGGGLSCELAKHKEKRGEMSASWRCEATGDPVFVELAELSLTDGTEALEAHEDGFVLVTAGDTTRIKADWTLSGSAATAGEDALSVTWSKAVLSASTTKIEPAVVRFQAKAPE